MLYFLLALPLSVALVAVQSSVLNLLIFAGGHPDLIIILLVLLTMYANYDFALVVAVIAGPLIDAVSGMPLGISVIPLISVVLLAHGGGKAIFGARLGWPVIVIFLGILLSGVITIIELHMIGWRLPWQNIVLDTLFPTAFLNALLASILYLPVVLFSERRDMHLR